MATTQPIRSKGQVRELANYFLHKGQTRNYVLFVLGVHTGLRISDLLRLKWDDVYDFEQRRLRDTVYIVEKKTRKSKIVALHKEALSALTLLARHARAGAFLIENPRTKRAISRIQAYRLLRDAARALALQIRVSCHSLRKTFGYHAWKSGVSPAIIMEIFNHSSYAVTKRYLGIAQDDKNAAYLGIQLFA